MRVKAPDDHRSLRRREYEEAGLSHEALIEALIEGDDDEIERIRAKRRAIKQRIPKTKGN